MYLIVLYNSVCSVISSHECLCHRATVNTTVLWLRESLGQSWSRPLSIQRVTGMNEMVHSVEIIVFLLYFIIQCYLNKILLVYPCIFNFVLSAELCSKSHDDRVLFDPTSAIWAKPSAI